MIVCVCRRVSHRDIEGEINSGCTSFEQLQDELGVATACGACAEFAREAFERACQAKAGIRALNAAPAAGSQTPVRSLS